MAAQIQHRRDTAANWSSNDPVLGEAEWGYETDTGKLKLGDGTTAWTALPYFESGGGGGGDAVPGDTSIHVGLTISTGAVVTIFDAADYQSDPRDYTAVGQVVGYHRFYDNPEVDGYDDDWGTAVRNEDGTFTLTSEGTPPTWSGATQRFAVILDVPQLRRIAFRLRNLADAEWIRVCGTGQSQNHSGLLYIDPGQAAPVETEQRYDWSTAGTAPFDFGNLALRKVVPTDLYEDTAGSSGIYVGFARTTTSGLVAQITNTFAYFISILTGRRVVTCNVSRPATSIDDPNGWTYDPSNDPDTHVGACLAREWGNMVAAIPAGNKTADYPHFFLMNQGQSDTLDDGKSANEYAVLLNQYITDCWNPDRYGFLDQERTTHLFFTYNDLVKDQSNGWNGPELGVSLVNQENVKIVSGANLPTHPDFGVHYSGESVDKLAERAAAGILGLGVFIAAKEAAFSAIRGPHTNTFPLDDGGMQFTWGGDVLTAPGVDQMNYDSVNKKVRLNKRLYFLAPGIGIDWTGGADVANWPYYQNSTMKFTDSGNAVEHEYVISKPPAEFAEYFEWEYDKVTFTGGTPSTTPGAQIGGFVSSMLHPSNMVSKTSLAVQTLTIGTGAENVVPGGLPSNYAPLVADHNGVIYRNLSRLVPFASSQTTTGTNPEQITTTTPLAAGGWVYRVEISAYRAADNEMMTATMVVSIYWSGSGNAVIRDTDVTYHYNGINGTVQASPLGGQFAPAVAIQVVAANTQSTLWTARNGRTDQVV